MIAFGGSGPIHALRIARKLRIPRVIFPAGAGVMSAFGLLASPVNHEIIKTENAFFDDLTAAAFAEKFDVLIREVSGYLRGAGVEAPDIRVSLGLDMRYVGQGYEIEVPLPEGCAPADVFKELPGLFGDNYEKVFSMRFGERPTEIVNWKAQARGPLPDMGKDGYFLSEFESGAGREALKGYRQAYFPEEGDYVSCPVYDRYALLPGAELGGPALIEENESTCVIGFGEKVVVDSRYNLVAEVSTA
jgi:N-methylhydantoinase A